MTGQTLLDTMELLNQELQLQSGEADVTRGLLALNIAQDHFEAAASKRPGVYGSGSGTITQTASQEYSTFPAGLLRLDSLWYLDPTTARPSWELTPRYHAGSQVSNSTWLSTLSSSNSTGKPVAYVADGVKIWWDPLPDTTNSVRWYGLQAAADLTASGTFTYADILRLPLASFAVSLIKIGVDDDPAQISSLSSNLFDSTLDLLGDFVRAGAKPLNYSYDHR